MRVSRVAVAVVVLVLSVGVAAPAAAQQTGPSAAEVGLSQVRISCAGDTVSGVVLVSSPVAVDVVGVLHVQHGSGAWQRTERTTTFAVGAGSAEYPFSLNTLGLPSTVTDYRVHLSAGTGEVTSHASPVRRCAPAAVVPEVPAAVLLPISLALSGLGVLLVRRRQEKVR